MLTKGTFARVSRSSSWLTLATACIFVALFLAIARPAPVRATTLERMSIEQLSQRATTIVEGTVVSTAVTQSSYGVRTAVRIKVLDTLKGVPSALKTVYVPGGTLPAGTQAALDGMASFRPGEMCYVFVDARGWVMGGFQGKLDVAGGRVVGYGATISSMSRRVRAALGSVGPVLGRPPFRGALTPSLPVAAGSAPVSSGEVGWFKQTSGSTAYLYGVDFSDATHGWAVGYNPSAWPGEVGTILATTNGGATWSAQSSGTMQSLYAVAFADAAHGWAVGGNDIILATTNGGATWSTQRPGRPAGDPVWAVDFGDVTHGWAVGRYTAFTADGGATWKDPPFGNGLIGYGSALHGIDFPDVSHGWAVGGNGSIFATTDGGANWKAQTSGTTVNLQGVAFSDASHGWAVGYGSTGTATIVATTDGGANWVTQWSESTNAPLLAGVTFSDSTHGWAVGRNNNGTSAILATANGGATWSAQTSGNIGELFSVSCSDANHCWAVGEVGAIIATTNGGWSTAPGGPKISSISPGAASAGTGTHVTIAGSGFGPTAGKVEFSYGDSGVMRISATEIPSWTGTSINCVVPYGVIKGSGASASSGPVVVTTADGKESNPFDFVVTFGFGGQRWASPGVTYLVNTSGIDDALRESLVDAAAKSWNAAGSGFTFTDGGATSLGTANDGSSVISWASGLPDGVVALTWPYADSSGDIKEADTQLSNAYVWNDKAAGPNNMDVQSVAVHELGHFVRLLDLYMPGDSSKVMYGRIDPNQQKRTLTAGDIAGITWIYPGKPADTVGPACAAKDATVKRGKTCTIYFKVHDALSAKVTKHLYIATMSGTVKKTMSTGYAANSTGWWTAKFTCRLAKGTYRIVVNGEDLAGNEASVPGKATLKVQ